MAHVNIAVDFDAEEVDLCKILDKIAIGIRDVTGEEPALGLQVDGEHRDPDEPASSLFS